MTNRKKLGIAIALCICFLFISYFSLKQTTQVTVSITDLQAKMDICAHISSSSSIHTIDAFYDGSNDYYLFLPSYAIGKKLSFLDCEYLTLTQAANSHPLAESQSYSLTNGDTLHILVGSNLPTAYLTLQHDLTYITSDQERYDSGQVIFLDETGNLTYVGGLEEIQGRGNTSWESEKKPFNISLEDAVSLYEIPASTEYSLITSSDISFIRNRISDSMAHSLDLLTMKRQQINLYVNGEYQGIYELCEKISADSLQITDLEASNDSSIEHSAELTQVTTNTFLNDWNQTVTGKWWDWYNDDSVAVTGGYIIEVDQPLRYNDEPSGFTLDSGAYIVSKEPTYLSESQFQHISSYVQDCEDAMYQALETGTTDQLQSYIDIQSFISKYLIEEVSKNIDSSATSQYFYISEDGLLTAGPVWDYDWAYGVPRIQNDIDYSVPIGFSAKNISGSLVWWQILYYIQDFYNEMITDYHDTLYPHLIQLTEQTIFKWEQELSSSAIMDYIKWNRATSEEVARQEYHEQITHVSDFLKQRMEFLYNEWNS